MPSFAKGDILQWTERYQTWGSTTFSRTTSSRVFWNTPSPSTEFDLEQRSFINSCFQARCPTVHSEKGRFRGTMDSKRSLLGLFHDKFSLLWKASALVLLRTIISFFSQSLRGLDLSFSPGLNYQMLVLILEDKKVDVGNKVMLITGDVIPKHGWSHLEVLCLTFPTRW